MNGDLIGDPLDVKMFESTGWILEEESTEEGGGGAVDDLVLGYVRPRNSKPPEKVQHLDSLLSISDISFS